MVVVGSVSDPSDQYPSHRWALLPGGHRQYVGARSPESPAIHGYQHLGREPCRGDRDSCAALR